MIVLSTLSENTKCMFLSRVAQERKMEGGEEASARTSSNNGGKGATIRYNIIILPVLKNDYALFI